MTIDVASHAFPQAFHRWLLSCWVPAWLCGVPTPFCCSTQPDTCGTSWPCCIVLPAHSMALALIPGCPAMDLSCRESLPCQVGLFSRDRGVGPAVGAAVSRALPGRNTEAWRTVAS